MYILSTHLSEMLNKTLKVESFVKVILKDMDKIESTITESTI